MFFYKLLLSRKRRRFKIVFSEKFRYRIVFIYMYIFILPSVLYFLDYLNKIIKFLAKKQAHFIFNRVFLLQLAIFPALCQIVNIVISLTPMRLRHLVSAIWITVSTISRERSTYEYTKQVNFHYLFYFRLCFDRYKYYHQRGFPRKAKKSQTRAYMKTKAKTFFSEIIIKQRISLNDKWS